MTVIATDMSIDFEILGNAFRPPKAIRDIKLRKQIDKTITTNYEII